MTGRWLLQQMGNIGGPINIDRYDLWKEAPQGPLGMGKSERYSMFNQFDID